MSDSSLTLGPVLRYVDETSAAVWVETVSTSVVGVSLLGRHWSAPTFQVHGHHYALVQVSDLEPGTIADYTVDIDGVIVWPPEDSPFPPSRIATLKADRDLRLAFGSCRTSVSHDAEGNKAHGVDAMRAYALHMAGSDADKWPDLVVFLGDQVYADLTSPAMQEFIAARRDPSQPPGEELKDYEEYAHLYSLAWSDPANRWLLSTLPSSMIFDDHDIRDDWNTSMDWRREMEQTSWWKGRIVAGLGSYWVYQHLGNLSPKEREHDEVWRQICDRLADQSKPDHDFGPLLDAFAERTDQEPDSYRWSYARDVGRNRVIVVDSRAARVLKPDERSILDEAELAWLDQQLVGGYDHLFIGTSLPYLLSTGLHEFEAWNEAVAEGAWGHRFEGMGEKIRRAVDLEHWAAFQEGFRAVADMVCEVADGKRGATPSTITFLSGDVHNSYVAEVDRPGPCRVLQATCSPIRNPLPRAVRYLSAFSARNIGSRIGAAMARSAKVPPPPFSWRTVHGPWFDNNLATLETDGRKLWFRWEAGQVENDDDRNPRLKIVAEHRVDDGPPTSRE